MMKGVGEKNFGRKFLPKSSKENSKKSSIFLFDLFLSKRARSNEFVKKLDR